MRATRKHLLILILILAAAFAAAVPIAATGSSAGSSKVQRATTCTVQCAPPSWQNFRGAPQHQQQINAVKAAVQSTDAATKKLWVCGKQPKLVTGPGLFAVDYNYDYSITAQPGTTGKNQWVLADEGASFKDGGNFSDTNLPVSQRSSTSTYGWQFAGSDSAAAASVMKSFAICTATFRHQDPIDVLIGSKWITLTTGSSVAFDPDLPDLNTDPNKPTYLMAMHQELKLS